MKTTIAAIAALALLLASAPVTAEPPAGSACPLGYESDALLNACLPPIEPIDLVREVCIVGSICILIPAALSDDGQIPTVVYIDAFCAVQEVLCGCSHILDNTVYSCTPLQFTEAASEDTPDEPGRDDNTLLVQEGDNCLPTTYEYEAFANACIVIGPEWGSGVGQAGDQVCVVGDVCIPPAPLLVSLTDGEGGVPWPVALYADALCNLPSGCGCGLYAQRLLLLCSPLQD